MSKRNRMSKRIVKDNIADDQATPDIIEGKTKSGIGFKVDRRILNDIRFLHYAVGMRNDDKFIAVKNMFEMYGLLFGGQDGMIRFENAVAAAHGGICTQQLLISELNEILEAIKAKN